MVAPVRLHVIASTADPHLRSGAEDFPFRRGVLVVAPADSPSSAHTRLFPLLTAFAHS